MTNPILAWPFCATLALLVCLQANSDAKAPTEDAAYLWQMADASNVAGTAGGLKAHGAVTFGVRLEGSERKASLARGGDGLAARFEGGYLALANDADLKVNPGRWTVAIRMRDPQGTWRYPILGSYGSEKEVSFALQAVDGSKKPFADRNLGGGDVPTIYSWMFKPGAPRSVPGNSSLLELVWGAQEPNAARIERIRGMQPEQSWPNPLQQDVLNGVMKPCFPVALIGPTDWHDIVVTLTGPKLELWVDGVLVDEEFPIGVTRRRTLPFLIGAGHENGEIKTGFKGLVDHVAIWNRPLPPSQIVLLSGGSAHVRQRELAILGAESPSMQYFRPRGHNRKAGDLIPYWDAQTGTFRLFYLILRRNMHSKWDGGLFHMIKVGPAQRTNTRPVRDKTLVAWVRLDSLDQRGGSVLTIERADLAQFDAIVFGERTPRRWMPGSNRFLRTPSPAAQNDWPEETAKPGAVVQMALVFEGNRGTLYRNGEVYASYDIENPADFPSGSSLMVGWRHTGAGPTERSYFHGRVLDARVYDSALSAQQLALLKADAEGAPSPLAWYDFTDGTTRDKMGNFPDGMLFGKARIEDGALVLGDGDYLKAPGALNTQVHLTSPDLEHWTEVEGPFISSDKHLAICPNVFRFGQWHYYICGSGVWRSPGPLGPWTEHKPLRLDNLSVPKTAAFGNKRRIYAGFLPDGGWGGNSVLRELVQDADGRLGTRFVPELIPRCGEALPVSFEPGSAKTSVSGNTVRLDANDGRQAVTIPKVIGDYRLQLEIIPGPGATSFGIGLRAGSAQAEDACDLIFEPTQKRVRFSKMSNSGGGLGNGPAIEAVGGLDKPFSIDIIVRHDILDAQIGGFRSLTTRFWNPEGDRIRLFADGKTVTFRSICIRRLAEGYAPYPAMAATDGQR